MPINTYPILVIKRSKPLNFNNTLSELEMPIGNLSNDENYWAGLKIMHSNSLKYTTGMIIYFKVEKCVCFVIAFLKNLHFSLMLS